MQVSHAVDHITHVVIGGKQTIDMGISDSPEFFAILSSALYKYPMLAMVRETICNAWDAHIDAGLTDKPISVTLDDQYLIIQDFGKGIDHALIGPVYGVYGASTKKNDGRQTGGFGLGCKSPYAYTDHFEVTSCHQGVKTIYNMTKSSAERNGKPGIVPIASFPTTESGITVKIPLNPTKANDKLPTLVHQVVFNGDIKANYNGVELPVLGLDTAEQGLVLLPDGENLATHLLSTISVRYGNVIYPVEVSPEYENLYLQCQSLLKKHYVCRAVLLAPPDSLSITPSREALTMTDITAGTINTLLAKFLAVFMKNQQMMVRHKQLIDEYVDEAAATAEGALWEVLPYGNWTIPGVPDTYNGGILKTLEEFSKLEVTIRAGSRRRRALKATQWFKHIQRYMYKLNENDLFDRGLYQSWARMFQKRYKQMSSPEHSKYAETDYHSTTIATQWWTKKILSPLVLKMQQHVPNFQKGLLYYRGLHVVRNTWHNDNKEAPKQVGYVRVKNHTQNLIHLITPTVVLCHGAAVLPKRLEKVDRTTLGANGTFINDTYFIYEVSRKQEELIAIREAMKNIPGIEFLDLTERLPHEQKAYEERQDQVAAERLARSLGHTPKTRLIKKAKAGMVRLDQLLMGGAYEMINTMIFKTNTDPAKITDPEAIVQVSTAQEQHHSFNRYGTEVSFAITKLYGDKIGVSNKSDAIERAKEKGAMNIGDYVYAKILHDVENLPSLVAYQNATPKKIQEYIDEKGDWQDRAAHYSIISMLTDVPELQHLAPDFVHLNPDDKLRWVLWENMHQLRNYDQRHNLADVKNRVEAAPLKPEIVTFLDKLISNPMALLIDPSHVSKYIRKYHNDPAAIAKLDQLLTTLLS